MKEVFYFVKLHSYSGKVLYLNLLGMIIMSLLEGVGILFLIPMISMSNIVNIETGGIPFLGFLISFKIYPINLVYRLF